MMLFAEYAIAAQAHSEAAASNPPAAMYLAIALAAVMVGMIVLIFIRTSMRRASRR
jgi:capsular polysaccharide biosynthesis protein